MGGGGSVNDILSSRDKEGGEPRDNVGPQEGPHTHKQRKEERHLGKVNGKGLFCPGTQPTMEQPKPEVKAQVPFALTQGQITGSWGTGPACLTGQEALPKYS